jgi:4a-hydroxytetrahydrobiopterin dehydratase
MKNFNEFKAFESKITLDLPEGWKKSNKLIKREFKFKDFITAVGFVNVVAEISNQINHHPKITIDFNLVLIETLTHDEGKVTNKDLELAEFINSVYLDRKNLSHRLR